MKRKMRRFADGGDTDTPEAGEGMSTSMDPNASSARRSERSDDELSFSEAFRKARTARLAGGPKTFMWRGKKYGTELAESAKPREAAPRRMSSEEFIKEYKKAPASGRIRQEASYSANPEPGLESVAPEEALFGPKAKAAAAGAGAAAAGYGLKKVRDYLLRRGQKFRSGAVDVAKGDLATARSAAAREAEAAAYAERIKNARRSPGMTGYKKGGIISSASKRADGCATKGKTRGKFV